MSLRVLTAQHTRLCALLTNELPLDSDGFLDTDPRVDNVVILAKALRDKHSALTEHLAGVEAERAALAAHQEKSNHEMGDLRAELEKKNALSNVFQNVARGLEKQLEETKSLCKEAQGAVLLTQTELEAAKKAAKEAKISEAQTSAVLASCLEQLQEKMSMVCLPRPSCLFIAISLSLSLALPLFSVILDL